MHGVVAGAEEHPAPQVGHLVGVPGLDAHQTAARADAREVLVGDRVPVLGAQMGSAVTANSVLRVLAGGSLRWASRAARTLPVRASATTYERADTSLGRAGASRRGRTCSPVGGPGWGAAAELSGVGARQHRPMAAVAVRAAMERNPDLMTIQPP